jgi:hypothetical protein
MKNNLQWVADAFGKSSIYNDLIHLKGYPHLDNKREYSFSERARDVMTCRDLFLLSTQVHACARALSLPPSLPPSFPLPLPAQYPGACAALASPPSLNQHDEIRQSSKTSDLFESEFFKQFCVNVCFGGLVPAVLQLRMR